VGIRIITFELEIRVEIGNQKKKNSMANYETIYKQIVK